MSIELVDVEPKVEWEPKVNRWTGAEIQAVLKGAETLEGPWEDVPEGSGSPGRLAPPCGSSRWWWSCRRGARGQQAYNNKLWPCHIGPLGERALPCGGSPYRYQDGGVPS